MTIATLPYCDLVRTGLVEEYRLAEKSFGDGARFEVHDVHGYYALAAVHAPDVYAEAQHKIDRFQLSASEQETTLKCAKIAAAEVVRALSRVGCEIDRVNITSEGGIAIHLRSERLGTIAMFDCGPYGIAAMFSDRATNASEAWDVEESPADIDHAIGKIRGRLQPCHVR